MGGNIRIHALHLTNHASYQQIKVVNQVNPIRFRIKGPRLCNILVPSISFHVLNYQLLNIWLGHDMALRLMKHAIRYQPRRDIIWPRHDGCFGSKILILGLVPYLRGTNSQGCLIGNLHPLRLNFIQNPSPLCVFSA